MNHSQTRKSNCKETPPKPALSCNTEYFKPRDHKANSMACEFFTGDYCTLCTSVPPAITDIESRTPSQKLMHARYSERQLPTIYRTPRGRGPWVPWPFKLADHTTVYTSTVDRGPGPFISILWLKLVLSISQHFRNGSTFANSRRSVSIDAPVP